MSNVDLSQLITDEDKAAAVQIQRAAGVNAERDRRINAGATVDLPGYGPVPVQGREVDRVNLLALKDTATDLLTAGHTDQTITFRDGDNVEHALTAAQIVALTNAAKRRASAVYAAAWALKDAADIPTDYRDDRHWPAGNEAA